MTLLISCLLIAASIYPVLTLLHVKKITSILLACYLLGFSQIILTAEICGFIGLLSNQWVFLLLQGFETLVFWGLWLIKRKPGPGIRPILRSFPEGFFYLLKSIKKHPFYSIFGAAVVLGYGVLAWLIVRVPPNNSDSMHTHLARVVYWLQQGSFKELTSYSIFAQIYPFDAQLNVLWTVLFTQSDKLVGFIQFFAAIICSIAIYGIARLLNGSRSSSLWAGLIWLTYPLVVFQATSTQFDLVEAALFVSAIYFFFSFYESRSIHELVYSALAMGLALGTKPTVYMMGPGIAVIVIGLFIQLRKKAGWLLKWAAITVAGFLILGSFPFINNMILYKNPLGPADAVRADSLGDTSIGDKLRYNLPRYLYQFASFDSLPVDWGDEAVKWKNRASTVVDKALHLNLESPVAVKDARQPFSYAIPPKFNEDEAWFGLAGFLVVFPSMVVGTIKGLKKRNFIACALIWLGISFMLFEIMLRPGWHPFEGRYFSLMVVVLSPLAVYLVNEKVYSRIFIILVTFVALVTLFFAVFSNQSKPIIGKRFFDSQYIQMEKMAPPGRPIPDDLLKIPMKIDSMMYRSAPFVKSIADYDDTELRTLNYQDHHTKIVYIVNRMVPQNARMGIMLVNEDFDYVFFGPKLTRVLINIKPESRLYDRQWIRDQHIPFILISRYSRFSTLPEYVEMLDSADGWGLFKVDLDRMPPPQGRSPVRPFFCPGGPTEQDGGKPHSRPVPWQVFTFGQQPQAQSC